MPLRVIQHYSDWVCTAVMIIVCKVLRLKRCFTRFIWQRVTQFIERRRYKDSKTNFEKKLFFGVGKYAEYGFDQQRLIWYVCRQWDMVFS